MLSLLGIKMLMCSESIHADYAGEERKKINCLLYQNGQYRYSDMTLRPLCTILDGHPCLKGCASCIRAVRSLASGDKRFFAAEVLDITKIQFQCCLQGFAFRSGYVERFRRVGFLRKDYEKRRDSLALYEVARVRL